MEFVQMKCPNCNADLDIDEGIDSFYCKYCGTKILVNGQSKHVVNAKAKIRMMDKLGDMQKELHRAQAERARRKAEEAKKVLPWLLGIFLFVIILSLSIAFFLELAIEKKKQNSKRSTLRYRKTFATVNIQRHW